MEGINNVLVSPQIEPVASRQLGDSLDEARAVICGDRQDSYGNPEDSFSVIAEYWTTYLKHRFNIEIILNPLDASNMMVLFKQARKLGQKPCRDNYVDSIGYEAIGADRLMGDQSYRDSITVTQDDGDGCDTHNLQS